MGTPSRGIRWQLVNSLWMLWTCVPTLGWVAFLWIGAKTREGRWLAWALVYFVVFFLGVWVPLAATDTDKHASLSIVIGLLVIIGVPVTLSHAFFARRQYLIRLQAFDEVEPGAERAQVAAIKADYTDTDAATRVRAVFAQCNDLIRQIEDEPALDRLPSDSPIRAHYTDALADREEGEALLDKAKLPHEFELAERPLTTSLHALEEIYKELTATVH